MNPLQKLITDRKPMTKIYAVGVGGCLMQDEMPLCLFLEPLSLKVIINTKEMIGLIEQVEMYNADEKTQALSTAAKSTLKLKGKDKLQMVNDVLNVGGGMLKDYTRAGGWFANGEAANVKNWTQHEQVYPLTIVDTPEDAAELTEQAANSDDEILKKTAFIPLTFFTEDEILEVVSVIKEIAASMRQSDAPVIPIKTIEGGEEGVSPNDLNSFPSTL